MKNEKYYLKTKIMKISNDELQENRLSLGNFIDFFSINLIYYDLKNSNIDDLCYEFIQTYDTKTILEFFENNHDYLDLNNYSFKDLKNLNNNKLNELLQYNYYDFLEWYGIEYFQYFIINEKDLILFKEYCNYNIQYDTEKDLYILCIDHIGTSWYMINTNYSLNNLMNNYIFDNTNDIYKLFENKD